jgi:hypothetical protein
MRHKVADLEGAAGAAMKRAIAILVLLSMVGGLAVFLAFHIGVWGTVMFFALVAILTAALLWSVSVLTEGTK